MIYAIGDLQGCYDPFRRLLDKLGFDPARDRLWLVGDLVNRGNQSLACLRFVRGLGEAAVTVLGNHDLALLALAQREDRMERANTTLRPVLEAPDAGELLAWLRHRPLLHRDGPLGWTMVHAGLARDWDVATAARLAGEVEEVLRGPDHATFFAHMYGDKPDHWDASLTGWDRLRAIVNCLTRLRFCRPDGSLDLGYKSTVAAAPAPLLPWFQLPGRASAGERIVLGHWVALERAAWPQHRAWCVDSGCVWDRQLTAMRLDSPTPEYVCCDCPPASN
ncbi:MAG: symmetrical bis(5'-nucleosyl)-tetraphosphatase [Salinisphaera sp.]|nr:symmetrical bis(5'-nucleosyl)-tetraphosphatase [Salinisphaera sp.]